MSNRKTNFGPRTSSTMNLGIIESTRQAVLVQPPGAAFPGQHDVKTWVCDGCHVSNPIIRLRCKFCGEDRGSK